MIKRSVYIGNPSYLKLKNRQLLVEEPESTILKGKVPIEDLAVLMLDHPQITISHQLIQQLVGNGVALISCDAHHLPNGLMLPMNGHSELTERWKYQLEASVPLKKQLWKQTVIAKIKNQRQLLQQEGHPVEPMASYLTGTTSGDERNMEGKAAKHYWKYLFEDFKRERFGESPNNYLNFGYAILRSMVARALVSSGMLTAKGIFHRNKYNPYCLADDIMEPYRPFIDQLVLEWLKKEKPTVVLDQRAKAHLLSVATRDVLIDEVKRPLFVAVTTTTASLYKCFNGERRNISYPLLNNE